MAIELVHDVTVTATNPGSPEAMIKEIYDWISGTSTGLQIVDSDDLEANGGWIVISSTGAGTWQLWLGATTTTTPGWDNEYRRDAAAYAANKLYYAFSPNGGWNAADNPDTAPSVPGDETTWNMFSDLSGAKTPAGWFCGIQRVGNNTLATDATPNSFSIINDPTLDYCFIMFDKGEVNVWAEGIGVIPIDSVIADDTAADDPTPYAVISGDPSMTTGSTHEWLYSSEAIKAGYGGLMLPGDLTWGDIHVSGVHLMDATSQPNPGIDSAVKYDTLRVNVKTLTAGIQHYRGSLDYSAVRQVSTTLGARQLLNSDLWIVPSAGAGCIIPWDGTTVP